MRRTVCVSYNAGKCGAMPLSAGRRNRNMRNLGNKMPPDEGRKKTESV